VAYEIEIHGPNSTTGIRVGQVNTAGFPPNYQGGSEVLAWGTDLISDPAGNGADPADGWKRGIGVGGAQA
jgi:hypothetical protein